MEVTLLDAIPDEKFEDFMNKYLELFIPGGKLSYVDKRRDQFTLTIRIGDNELFVHMGLHEIPQFSNGEEHI